MGLWEGVPLREVVWLTQPRDNLRRVFYYGYHNDDPQQMFRSSLPIGRVLEDPFDFPPVILCYKLNGEWLDSKRGGPVDVEGATTNLPQGPITFIKGTGKFAGANIGGTMKASRVAPVATGAHLIGDVVLNVNK